jgi:signal transduction histidine kinase/HPt (histidine-containing phosphotransfer) domain-containing protein/ActR/RegA family two-component response regulator
VLRQVAAAVRASAHYSGALLGLCAVVLLWAAISHLLSVDREQAEQAAVQTTANLARAFEEHIVGVIREVDQTLLYVRESYSKDPGHFDLSLWARDSQLPTDLTFQTAIIGKDGYLVATSLGPVSERMDLSDREHFRVHAESTRDELFISKPVFGRASNKWSIQLTRRINMPDGSFGGVVVVSLDPHYLERFYESVDLGAEGAVVLVGLDGIVRARAALGDTTIGQPLAGGRLLASYAERDAGTFANASPIDHVERIYSYRGVKGLPLIVAVGLAKAEVFADYEQRRRSYNEEGSALSVLLVVISGLIGWHQRGMQKSREQLKASEARAAQKSALLEVTLDNMSQGILMVDAERNVQVCNRRAAELLDLPRDLLDGQPKFDDVLRWQWGQGEFGKDGSGVEEWLRSFVLSGGIADEPQSYERERPNGTVLDVRSAPLADGGVVRTYTDVTERKRSEAALRAARDAADKAARAKTDFLAMMSHEIRSPMSGVLGVIELVRDTPLDPEQARMIEMVHRSAVSLLGVLNDVLDFSKIEAGAIAVALEPTAVRPLVDGTIELMSLVAATKGLALSQRVADDVPDAVITDGLRLRQILVNLLSNAIKFTSSGSVDLSVHSAVAEEGGVTLQLSVSDTGIGMEPEVLARLFEPFTQADGSTTRNFGGTGLGLSISRRLAHLLGGTLTVTSEPGKGSRFTLELPMLAAAAPLTSPKASSAGGRGRIFDGARVLIVEDDPTNRWLARRQLERLGFKVDAAEDGFVAFELATANAYDAIVTDCHMPGMDGTGLATRIRETEARTSRAPVPIIGLTADITTVTRERCLGSGMNAVESKPIQLAQLEAALCHLLGRGRGGEPPDAAPMPTAETTETPVFDLGPFHELFEDGDPDGADWLQTYLDAAARSLDDVRRALADCDRDKLSTSAHRLAGSSLCAGARRLGVLCQRIEALAQENSPQQLAAMVSDAALEFDAARGAITRFVAG